VNSIISRCETPRLRSVQSSRRANERVAFLTRTSLVQYALKSMIRFVGNVTLEHQTSSITLSCASLACIFIAPNPTYLAPRPRRLEDLMISLYRYELATLLRFFISIETSFRISATKNVPCADDAKD
jgi:hypothetical protein